MNPLTLYRRYFLRRSISALTASFLLHVLGAVVLWCSRPPFTRVESPQHLTVPSLVWFDVPAPPVTVAPLNVPSVAAAKMIKKGQHPRKIPKAEPTLSGQATQNSNPPPGPRSLVSLDRPRSIDLMLRLDSVDLPAFGGVAVDDPSTPSLSHRHEEGAVNVEGTVKSLVQKGLAEAKLNDGVVEPAVAALHSVLNKAVEEVPEYLDPQSTSERREALKRSWQLGAERYGRTGAPYWVPPSATDDGLPSEIRNAAMKGNPKAIELGMQSYAGARLREFGQGLTDKPLMVRVSIELAPKGLESIRILSGSGAADFDAWVLEQATTAVRSHMKQGNTVHPTSRVRSIWEYLGTVTYMRKREKIGVDDLPYIALMTTSNLLTGTFDERSGKAEYVDLRYPHYTCKTKLVATEDIEK